MLFQQQINYLIYEASYGLVFGLSLGYFLLLYIGLAPLFNATCKLLHRYNKLSKITAMDADSKQLKREIKHSINSIIIFAASALPIIYLIRSGIIQLLPDNITNAMLGIVLLTLWNECYFFMVHRLMHYPWWMKHVHYIHHQSKVPTVYSVYSFHWIEAFLLGSVQLVILPIVPISAVAIFVYPLTSVLLNYAGHCNYRFGNGTGKGWQLFGTHHNEHHHKGRKNYGFALNIFDTLLSKIKNRPHST